LKTLVENQEILEKTVLMSQFSRWNQISKYFLPSRTGKFLQLEYNNIIETKRKAEQFSKIMIGLQVEDFKSDQELEIEQEQQRY